MSDRPECTVVMAVYNEERHLREALTSVLGQKDVDLEVILVDDKSTDRTADVAGEVAENDPRVSVSSNPRKGKVSAFNLGVSSARGRFVCLFAGDDVMPVGSLRERLDRMANTSDEIPSAGLCKMRVMSDLERCDGVVIPRAPGKGSYSGASYLMNCAARDVLFPIPEALPNEDTWMALVAEHLKAIKLIHSDVIGCNWRMHEGNSTSVAQPFALYTHKLAVRNEALQLFMDRYGDTLTERERALVDGRIRCESMRRQGRVLGVMLSPIPLVDRLRALSTTRPMLYRLHRGLYSFTSGH